MTGGTINMAQLTYRQPARTRVVIVLVAAVVLAAIAVVALLWVTHSPPSPPRTAPANASASTSSAPVAADVAWRQVAGVALPFSRLHGPRITTSGQAAGLQPQCAGRRAGRRPGSDAHERLCWTL